MMLSQVLNCGSRELGVHKGDEGRRQANSGEIYEHWGWCQNTRKLWTSVCMYHKPQ